VLMAAETMRSVLCASELPSETVPACDDAEVGDGVLDGDVQPASVAVTISPAATTEAARNRRPLGAIVRDVMLFDFRISNLPASLRLALGSR